MLFIWKSGNRLWKWTIVLEGSLPLSHVTPPLLSPLPICPPPAGLHSAPLRSVYADAWCSGTSHHPFISNDRTDDHPRHGPHRHPLCAPHLQPQPRREFPPPTLNTTVPRHNWCQQVTNPSLWALSPQICHLYGIKLITAVGKSLQLYCKCPSKSI